MVVCEKKSHPLTRYNNMAPFVKITHNVISCFLNIILRLFKCSCMRCRFCDWPGGRHIINLDVCFSSDVHSLFPLFMDIMACEEETELLLPFPSFTVLCCSSILLHKSQITTFIVLKLLKKKEKDYIWNGGSLYLPSINWITGINFAGLKHNEAIKSISGIDFPRIWSKLIWKECKQESKMTSSCFCVSLSSYLNDSSAAEAEPRS